MEKAKITKTFLKQGFDNIIAVGYCHLQRLLCRKVPYFYNATTQWNYDVYIINSNTCLCTGYRPFGNIKADYNIVKKYDKIGELMLNKYHSNYNLHKLKSDKLIQRFVREVLRKEGK